MAMKIQLFEAWTELEAKLNIMIKNPPLCFETSVGHELIAKMLNFFKNRNKQVFNVLGHNLLKFSHLNINLRQ